MPKVVGLLIALITGVAVAGGSELQGLRPNDEVSAWEPVHVAGPHAGTKTCPVCTYLDAPVLLAFAKDLAAAGSLAGPLEEIAETHRQGKLKVMLVVLDASDDQLRRLAKAHSLRRMMLCHPDPAERDKQLAAYKIDPSAPASVILYQDYLVRKAWPSVTATTAAELKKATAPYLLKR